MAFWPINWEPGFCQIWDWWLNINNNISFYFTLSARKTNNKIFQNFSNFPKFEQKWVFREKGAMSDFKYSNYLPLCQKSEKINEQVLRQMPNWQTDRRTRQTDRTENGDFSGLSQWKLFTETILEPLLNFTKPFF